MKKIYCATLSIVFSFSCYAGLPYTESFFDFDPTNILVEDPNVVLLTELPSGDVNLKDYHASSEDIRLYSENYKVEEGAKKDNPKAPNCTRAEIAAAALWQTNVVYENVNKILRTAQKGKVDGKPVTIKDENLILMIASATNCAPAYEGPVVRGEKVPPFIFEQYKEGNLLGLRGFTSTTKGNELSGWFETLSRQRIFIENARGADFDVLGVSPWPNEKEVLIRPGTVFKVLKKAKATNSKYIEWDFGFSQF